MSYSEKIYLEYQSRGVMNEASNEEKVEVPIVIKTKTEWLAVIHTIMHESITKDDDIVADVKETVNYQCMHQKRTEKKPSVEVSEEDVEDYLKKINYVGVVLHDDLDDAPKKISMLGLILVSADHRDTIEEIELELDIEPDVIKVNSQVIDIKDGYNIHLGHPRSIQW